MLDAVHRVLTGQTVTKTELRIAGGLLLAWFLMDFVEWIDWLHGKIVGVCQ